MDHGKRSSGQRGGAAGRIGVWVGSRSASVVVAAATSGSAPNFAVFAILLEGFAQDLAHGSAVDVPSDTVEVHGDISDYHHLGVAIDVDGIGVVGA